jgi:threonine/homoserine/homoserine lactone efflux protein
MLRCIECPGLPWRKDIMLGLDQIAGFLAAAVLITLSPGPDNLMVLSLGISRGRSQGMAFGLGCSLGCLSHTTLAVLGISALIAASAAAFLALKIAGGAYLVWLGVQALRSRASIDVATPSDAGKTDSLRSLFAKGLVANAVNPKVILFFLAFLPQFVDPARGAVPGQTALLGILFTVQSALIFPAIGYFAGRVGQLFRRNPAAGKWLDRIAGTVFIVLGLRLLLVR